MWQSALADGCIKESEDLAFREMAKDLSLDDETILKIKETARKEMGLSHSKNKQFWEMAKNLSWDNKTSFKIKITG